MIRTLIDPMLVALSPRFAALYAKQGRPSIAPEKLLRALLLQVLYTIRSERQLMAGRIAARLAIERTAVAAQQSGNGGHRDVVLAELR